jgi:nickel/cobalt exporter
VLTVLKSRRSHAGWVGILALLLLLAIGPAAAHPLGNFTVNHFARLTPAANRVAIHYVVDMAEIAAFQELQQADADGDGSVSEAELGAYADRAARSYAGGLMLTIDGQPVPLRLTGREVSRPPGVGGLSTLRLECEIAAAIPASASGSGGVRRLHFEDPNRGDRIGWHEAVVAAGPGISIFDSSAYANGVSDELRAYPTELLATPLNERTVELSFAAGPAPAAAAPLRTRDGRPAQPARDLLGELLTRRQLTPMVALLGLLLAFGLGAVHALSPGHGKTIVGAYLIGARGTARHAAFLGLTVTLTHTAGVFALGLVTLFASRYVLPERFYPALSFVSGAMVVVIGAHLFISRLRAALGHPAPHHAHGPDTQQPSTPTSELPDTQHPAPSIATFDHPNTQHPTPSTHSHFPPGADGTAITWRTLLALGISGGMLPCPSALVVLLSAIALHRTGYGLLLVGAFSLGLASVLTGIGLLFVGAGRLLNRPRGLDRLARVLPVAGAFVVTCAGVAICWSAVAQSGLDFSAWGKGAAGPAGPLSTAGLLGIGLVFGLKHALEADHLAAVTTIVSERKSVWSSSLVGGLWGIGHTISLLVAGVAVILLHLQIGEKTALALEFCVALMLIALGVNALRKLRRGGTLHVHVHQHGGHTHAHPHLHGEAPEADEATHHGFRLNARPLLVGMVHGMAGSAALMLLVLSTIPSAALGFAYIGVFGLGSVGGMMLMSALVGLPMHLTAARFTRANLALRALAGTFSLGFGLFMVYNIGFVDGLFR